MRAALQRCGSSSSSLPRLTSAVHSFTGLHTEATRAWCRHHVLVDRHPFRRSELTAAHILTYKTEKPKKLLTANFLHNQRKSLHVNERCVTPPVSGREPINHLSQKHLQQNQHLPFMTKSEVDFINCFVFQSRSVFGW